MTHVSPVFQRLQVTGWYTRPRLCHTPVYLCGVNLCTLVYRNLPDSNCSIAQLLCFKRGAGNCVPSWWTLMRAILWKKVWTFYM